MLADHRSCTVTVRDIELQHATTVFGGALLFVVEDRREWGRWVGGGTTKHWCKGCICIHTCSGMCISIRPCTYYISSPSPPHPPTHMHMHTPKQHALICRFAQVHTMHVGMHEHTHTPSTCTHIHTCACTHTHMHTCTHTQITFITHDCHTAGR